MNPNTIYQLDRLGGPPVCAALSALRGLGRLRGPRRPYATPQKILFLKMVEQGATVLACPAIQTAIQQVGRENVFFWVFQENREIVDIIRLIPPENVLVLRAKKLGTFLPDLLSTIRRIRAAGIDTVIDMEFFSRSSAIFAFLTGARTRVGLHRYTSELPYRGNLFSHRVQYNPHLHTVQLYHLLVNAAFTPPADEPLLKSLSPPDSLPMPRFVPAPEEVAKVQGILRAVAGRDVRKPLILLNPNASDIVPLRKWPTERFADLARRILEKYPTADIALTGAPVEAPRAEALVRELASPRVFSLAGKTTMRDLLAIYTLADVLVTNDSGPGHFSSMTDIDAIILFGPETPRLWRPLGPHSHILWAGLACSPCVNPFNHRFSPCRYPRCMQAITTDQVWAKLGEVLERRLAGQPLPAAAPAATAGDASRPPAPGGAAPQA